MPAPIAAPAPLSAGRPLAEPLLLSTVRISTFLGQQSLTAATGFFFERGSRLFLVTSRHVLFDEAIDHLPDRIEITMHTDTVNLTRTITQSILLYKNGKADWRQGRDSGGEIDVAVLEIDRAALPASALLYCYGPDNLQPELDAIRIGTTLLLPGFPLGFYDTVHHLPVVRHAAIASSFGVRFQGQGYFLTDARTHRGSSGAPVVMRDDSAGARMPWRLLGVHSARMDMGTRDLEQDESLGLNCAWYADVLLTLTKDAAPAGAAAGPAPAA